MVFLSFSFFLYLVLSELNSLASDLGQGSVTLGHQENRFLLVSHMKGVYSDLYTPMM